MVTISVARTSLALPALVFGTPDTGLWLPEDGLSRPVRSWRRSYAAESPWVHGAALVSAVLEQSTLPFSATARGDSSDGLAALMAEVEEAFAQFTYETTVADGGVEVTWRCDPADVAWSDHDSGMAAACIAKVAVTIPVYPVPVI